MKKNMLLIGASIVSVMLFTGCSGKSNLLGVGQDSGDCEGVVSKMGVCGSPIEIYKNRDLIKKVKDLPREGDEIYSIDHNGKVWVSHDDGETKELVDFSEARKQGIIQNANGSSTSGQGFLSSVEMNNGNTSNSSTSVTNKYASNFVDNSLDKNRDVLGDDLVAVYQKQGTILKQSEAKNYVIRDYGQIQKIWMAPYEDKDEDLHTAQTIYVVVKEPSWNVGETKPKKVNKMRYEQTPISEKVFETQQVKIGEDRESVLVNYIDNKDRETTESINNLESNIESDIKSNFDEMDKFLNEGK